MTVPDGAPSTRIAGGVRMYDVSALMPTNSARQYSTRPVDTIRRVFVHHSGALGKSGFAGALASAVYVVKQKRWTSHGTPQIGFPGPAYHYWIPANDERDIADFLVIYRLVPESLMSWHSGGQANREGIGVALQGNTTRKRLTSHHVECLEALLPWLAERHGLDLSGDGLSWHSEADRFGGKRKAACPGKHATVWLDDYRSGAIMDQSPRPSFS